MEAPNASAWNSTIAADLSIPLDSVAFYRKRLLRSITGKKPPPAPKKQAAGIDSATMRARVKLFPADLPSVRRRRHRGGKSKVQASTSTGTTTEALEDEVEEEDEEEIFHESEEESDDDDDNDDVKRFIGALQTKHQKKPGSLSEQEVKLIQHRFPKKPKKSSSASSSSSCFSPSCSTFLLGHGGVDVLEV